MKKDPAPNLSADRHPPNGGKGRVWSGAGEELSPELYEVARKGGTEQPFTGKYWNTHDKGMYKCAVCGNELFSSDAKFDSGTGWPSFGEPANRENVELVPDTSHGMNRTEVKCKKCSAHLGHVFDDLPAGRQAALGKKRGKRYCINSVSLELEKSHS